MFVRVLIYVDGPYAPAPIWIGSVLTNVSQAPGLADAAVNSPSGAA